MEKRVGILGLMAVMAAGLFPAAAVAQDRDDYRRGYGQHEYRERDREWRGNDRWRNQEWREHEWRENRERREWREHEWRERSRYEQPYYRGYGYYQPPVVTFGYYGR